MVRSVGGAGFAYAVAGTSNERFGYDRQATANARGANRASLLARRLIFASVPLALCMWALPAHSLELKPFKDKLFAYPRILDVRDGGAFERVEYVRDRDLVNRDEVLRIRVRNHYVNLKPARRQKTRTLTANGRTLKHIAVGKLRGGAKAIVINLHGAGGNRFVAANDWSYGGNYNRVKNLMLRNDGLYISPDFTDFAKAGKADIKALIQNYATLSPSAPVFLGCTSMSGLICWNLMKDAEIASLLGGVLFFGSVYDYGFLKSATYRSSSKPIPIYLGHATKDPIYKWQDQETFYKAIRSGRKGYPVRFTLFDTGSHGTPVRMTDWRLILNWMLAKQS